MSAPPELSEVQRFLAGAFRREAPIGDDEQVAAATRVHVAGNDRLSPLEQADIYRQQFWLRHFEALREDFPGLRALIGDEAWEALMTAYLNARPPRHPSLRDLAEELPAFAASWEGFPADRRDAAIEMIRYERALVEVFDGPEPAALDAQKLGAMPPEAWDTARVMLAPLLVLLRFAHPVHRWRLAAMEAIEAGASMPPSPPREPVGLALFRRDFTVIFDELEPPAFAILEALAEGSPLPHACERAVADLNEADAAVVMAKVGGWFQQWAASRWIAGVIP